MEIWERQPQETQNAWNAFTIYRELPVSGDVLERRSLANVRKVLGHSVPAQVEKWSAKYNWVERVAAYDAYIGKALVTTKEAGLADLQQAVISQLQEQLMASHKVIQRRLRELLSEDDVPAMEIERVLRAMKLQDDLARRVAQLPTSFKSESATEADDDTIYIIGG